VRERLREREREEEKEMREAHGGEIASGERGAYVEERQRHKREREREKIPPKIPSLMARRKLVARLGFLKEIVATKWQQQL